MIFDFVLTTSSVPYSGNKKKYVLDWPIVPNTWLVIGTNLPKEKVLVLEDA